MNVTFNEGFLEFSKHALFQILSAPSCYHFSYWNLSPSLCFVHSPGSLFSPNFCASVSWIFLRAPPPALFSLHLGAWLPKQMGLWGKEKLKVKQQPKRSSTPSLPLQIAEVRATEGIPTDKTTTDFSMTLKHTFVSQEVLSLSNLHTIRHLPSFSLAWTAGQVTHTWIVKSVNSALPSWMDAYGKYSNYN